MFDIASQNLTRLQGEIYRVCYLSQAGGESYLPGGPNRG